MERAGAPISKAKLIERAWPGLAIEDSNLTVQIAALRRVFAEKPGGKNWIETLPRRGYSPLPGKAGRGGAGKCQVTLMQQRTTFGVSGPSLSMIRRRSHRAS